MSGADKVGTVGSLSVPVVAGIVVLFDRPKAPAAIVDVREPGENPNLTQVSARR